MISDEEFNAARNAAAEDGAGDDAIAAWARVQVCRDVTANFATYSNWYLVLVACHQVRELTSANIDNFCKMCRAKALPGRTLSYLKYWAGKQQMLVENPTVRARFEDNLFFEYHTSGSSTPQLCGDALAEAEGLGVFTQREEAAIRQARRAPHNLTLARNIPALALVKTSAVLKASGTLPEIWYMGSKAVDRFSGKKYSAMVKYMSSIFSKQTNAEDLNEKSLETLVADFTALLKTVDGAADRYYGGGEESSSDDEDSVDSAGDELVGEGNGNNIDGLDPLN